MRDIPIIFSRPMVLALLREARAPGTGKSMTRRLAWSFVHRKRASDLVAGNPCLMDASGRTTAPSPWRTVKPGDRLWVRENLKRPEQLWRYSADDAKVICLAKHRGDAARWSDAKAHDHAPSIHMPRWASRLTLVVTETKIERLHQISRADVLAEGIPPDDIEKWEQWLHRDDCQGKAFGVLWDSLHGKGEWDKNHEVVAVRFKVHELNIDAMKEAA